MKKEIEIKTSITKKDVEKRNIDIAIFMGAIWRDYGCGTYALFETEEYNVFKKLYISELPFNTSWDWMHLVIDKIESLGYETSMETNITNFEFTIYKTDPEVELVVSKRVKRTHSKIESAFLAVSDFCIIYKATKEEQL